MILLTLADVFGRRFLNHSVYGAHELQQFALMIAAFFTLAVCQIGRHNVTIDLIADFLPQRVLAYLDVVFTTLAFIGYSLLLWRLLYQSAHLKEAGMRTPELLLPEWPFLALAGGIGIAAFVLTLALTISQAIAEATKK